MSRKLAQMEDDIELASLLNPTEHACTEIVIEIPDNLEINFRPEECIYRAPTTLRDSNNAAFTPRLISIGPFHHDDKKLKPMEIQKQRYLREFCKRIGVQTKEQEQVFLENLLRTIKGYENVIRLCYAADDDTLKLREDDSVTSYKFAKMILLDAVFILELFLKNKEYVDNKEKYQKDFIIGKPWLRAAIQRDLILLENQLPFSFLKKLYSLVPTNKSNYLPFMDLSCLYFDKYDKIKSKPPHTLHFTDLVRYFLTFKHPEVKYSPVDGEGEPIKNLYSATMLKRAGIKFKPLPKYECLLDIRAWNPVSKGKEINPVKKGELHVPPLEIDNSTECLFQNLMALEQCHYPREEYICCYVKLLDFLVDVEKDVDLLVKNKVIVSKLGDSKAVAKLINKLCLEIVEVPSSYDALAKQLNDYYESSWNKNKAYLVRVYFKNVWIGTATVAGLIILAITIARFILFFFR